MPNYNIANVSGRGFSLGLVYRPRVASGEFGLFLPLINDAVTVPVTLQVLHEHGLPRLRNCLPEFLGSFDCR